MNNTSLPKIWFLLSLLLTSFTYGFLTQKFGWFPNSLIDKAERQAAVALHNQRASPRIFDHEEGSRAKDPEKIQPGLTLLISSWVWEEGEGLEPGAKLIDRNGEVVHYWRPNIAELFPEPPSDPSKEEVHGSYLLPNGDLVLILSNIGAAQIDACGKVKWRLQERNHHSVARSDDGTFWIPGGSSKRKTKTSEYPDGLPGLRTPVYMDRILHVGEDGAIVDDINVLDILYSNGLKSYILKGAGSGGKLNRNDPVHLNDIEPLSSSIADEYPLFDAGDLLVSLKYPNLVFVVDPESNRVKWYESRYFTDHHDPDFIGDGWVGVFDNRTDPTKRGEMLGGTRIVKVQPHTDSVHIPFPTRRSEHHYTSVRGKWQQLENGNMLLVEANAGRVIEVAPDGHTVWEWVHEPYENPILYSFTEPDLSMPYVTKATRVELTREEVASWPCSSVDSKRTSVAN